jgi:hypothetical protein
MLFIMECDGRFALFCIQELVDLHSLIAGIFREWQTEPIVPDATCGLS